MLSFNKLVVSAAAGASLLLAACGGSSHNSTSGRSAASSPAAANASPSAGQSASNGALTIGTARASVGTYLTGASGRALYVWMADSKGRSSCAGTCASLWPPLRANSMPKVAGGASAADISLISRSDGTKQVAYKGRPLYYYAGDTGPGMTNGQGSNGFGAKWWLIGTSGAQITSSAAAASPSSPASSSSTASPGGGTSANGGPYGSSGGSEGSSGGSSGGGW